MKVQEILRELVAIPSPFSVSNRALLDWVMDYLQAREWQMELLEYTDERDVPKANLLAWPPGSWRDAEQIELAFVCHSDTVPLSGGWTAATELKPDAEGKNLHGCGACDVKGALACFLAAVDQLQVRQDAVLILTADEEIGCRGVERLLNAKKMKIRSAIVSEPTSLRPGIAGKGYGLARVRVQGREAHSAYPQEGLSAIALAAKLIPQIEDLGKVFAADPNSAQAIDTLFDPPHTTLNIGVIEGGSAKNIVPGHCWFLVEWRPIPADAPRGVLAQLEWLCDGLRLEEPTAHIRVEPLRAERGFNSAGTGPLQLRLKEIAEAAGRKFAPTGISFGSEATRLAEVAHEVIVVGPGDMHTAHSDRECVPLAELEEWTETLRQLLRAEV